MLAALLAVLSGCTQGESAASIFALQQEKTLQQTAEAAAQQPLQQEENSMAKLEIQIGENTFTASLYDNETARAFADLLPLQVSMYELNGNEKYANLTQDLPTAETTPDSIRTGDLMLFGSDCLVLFYKDFATTYRYTPLGRLDSPEHLAQILGSGNITATFQIAGQ